MGGDIPARWAHLVAVGLGHGEVDAFVAAQPSLSAIAGAGPDGYAGVVMPYLQAGEQLWRKLPPKPQRSPEEAAAAEELKAELHQVRLAFLRRHGESVYRHLTGNYATPVRLRPLLYAAAQHFPHLVPTQSEVSAECQLALRDKEGVENDQALFLSQVLGTPQPGAHLVQAMLRPRPESAALLAEFQRTGIVDLGTAVVRRQGKVGCLYLTNPAFLNAEDDTTVDALEIGTDLILMAPEVEVGVLRGGKVTHPKHLGRRIFNSGINLTHLYHGRISYSYFLTREMGFVNKLYRGLCLEESWSHELETTHEKPWLGVVDGFAIGGGCQLLPVFDHVLAEEGSYFTLPARREGIIPGAANFRLPRLVGDRLTRQAILFDRVFHATGNEGSLLCDTIVPADQMDDTVMRLAVHLMSSGPVSVVSNRRALRVIQEPLQAFQAYMAVYAREQATCYFSPALVRNLESGWQAARSGP